MLVPANAPKIMTPSQLNRLARDLLEGSFGQLWIEAEISGFTRAASGHWYFTLKDSRAQLRCAMFRGANQSVATTPGNGDQIQARGKVSLFEARGDFQFIIDRLQPAGLGAILRAFEALKASLEAEGLFAPERKRPLPKFPNRVAIVSSAKGAAIHDVLSIIARRWPLLAVDLYSTTVQGNEAAADIRTALKAIAKRGAHYDLVLLTRGGGAREDLLPFDDEALARVIVAQPQPVISAIGHETDFTIADLAADMRAATPSAAAEQMVPDASVVLRMLEQQQTRQRRALSSYLRDCGQRHDLAATQLRNLSPKSALQAIAQKLRSDQTQIHSLLKMRLLARLAELERLRSRVQAHWPAHRLKQTRIRLTQIEQRWARLHVSWSSLAKTRLDDCLARLRRLPLRSRMDAYQNTIASQQARMPRALARTQQDRNTKLAQTLSALRNLGPDSVLARGYALLLDSETGAPLRSVAALPPGKSVQARLADGQVALHVDAENGSG